MATGRSGRKLGAMDRKTTITLELLLAGDGVSGRAVGEGGEAREFSGRLGLMHTIDELLAAAGKTEEGPAAEPSREKGREER